MEAIIYTIPVSESGLTKLTRKVNREITERMPESRCIKIDSFIDDLAINRYKAILYFA